MKKKPIIQLKNVWKIYKMGEYKINALQGINLEVYEGEFLAVQGPSGSGKSTAMNLIGCLDVPSKGTILLDNKDISLMTESDLAQIRGRKIGFVFQRFNLLQNLSALENIMLPMIFQGFSPIKRKSRAKSLLRKIGLGDRMSHKPGELSGGEQQRVAIARALAVDASVILADEPTGNLDSKTGREVLSYLKELNKEGKTIVMVTHDDNLARMAKRIAHLKDGRIVKRGRLK